MKKLLITVASADLAATSAQAAPGFGGSLSASGDGSSASVERSENGFLRLFMQLVRLDQIASSRAGGASDSGETAGKQAQCPEDRAAEAPAPEKSKPTRQGKDQGPEPLFFAF